MTMLLIKSQMWIKIPDFCSQPVIFPGNGRKITGDPDFALAADVIEIQNIDIPFTADSDIPRFRPLLIRFPAGGHAGVRSVRGKIIIQHRFCGSAESACKKHT